MGADQPRGGPGPDDDRPAAARLGGAGRAGDARGPAGQAARVRLRGGAGPVGRCAVSRRARCAARVSSAWPARAQPTGPPAWAERHLLPRPLLGGVEPRRGGRRHPAQLGIADRRGRDPSERRDTAGSEGAAAAAARPPRGSGGVLWADRGGPAAQRLDALTPDVIRSGAYSDQGGCRLRPARTTSSPAAAIATTLDDAGGGGAATLSGMDDPGRLRISDDDRNKVAEVLRHAAGEGRIDLEELDERLDAAYRAKTYGELVPITADLPVTPVRQPVPARQPVRPAHPGPTYSTSVAIMSASSREGRWTVPDNHVAFALMGSVLLDLREAAFVSHEVVINASA